MVATDGTASGLLGQLEQATNAALVLGAGVSMPCGIPAGPWLPFEFGAEHPGILTEARLVNVWERADATGRRPEAEVFSAALIGELRNSEPIQAAFVDWLAKYPAFAGVAHDDPRGDAHRAFVAAWLQGRFRHLVTTNWDFILEAEVDAVYDLAYSGDPFDDVRYANAAGTEWSIPSSELFQVEPLAEDEGALNPRWDICSSALDLPELRGWSRPLWKVHGSPFFLACPKCRGITRWRRQEDLSVGDPCREHPDQRLVPELVLWGTGVDDAHPLVWQFLAEQLRACDLVVVCGHSGSDDYLRRELAGHRNTWVINPSPDRWADEPVRYVEGDAAELAGAVVTPLLG